MDELKTNLKKQIVECLNLKDVNPESIDDNAPLFGEGLGLDSIDALEIVVLLQQQYGIKITNAEEAKAIMQSVASIAAYIESHKSN
ncbi:MAG: acyl carrier protein [Bacteroidetes bacterium]|nr:acyl carrier protein [Bacteroidota bacterium]